MRSLPLMIGIFLIMIAIPGYLYSPSIITNLAHSMMSTMGGGGSHVQTSAMLKQMGYPSRAVVISMTEYSFAGMEIAGAGLVLFGAVAKKKIPKKSAPKVVAESQIESAPIQAEPNPVQIEKKLPNVRSLRILEERLAKGEITPIQFQSLKQLLE